MDELLSGGARLALPTITKIPESRPWTGVHETDLQVRTLQSFVPIDGNLLPLKAKPWSICEPALSGGTRS
jgi:hypothetical protein